jgi:hypothetical protein
MLQYEQPVDIQLYLPWWRRYTWTPMSAPKAFVDTANMSAALQQVNYISLKRQAKPLFETKTQQAETRSVLKNVLTTLQRGVKTKTNSVAQLEQFQVWMIFLTSISMHANTTHCLLHSALVSFITYSKMNRLDFSKVESKERPARTVKLLICYEMNSATLRGSTKLRPCWME